MFSIRLSHGLYKAQTVGTTEFAPTIEKLLAKLDPGAPPEKIAAAAEILEGIIGTDHDQIHHGIVSA